MPCVLSSSLSQWVHACDALELPGQQREHLDAFIDQLYKDVDKGQRFISAAQRRRKQIIPVTAGLICAGCIVRANVSRCERLSRPIQTHAALTVALKKANGCGASLTKTMSVCPCRDGRLPELRGLGTLSAPELM